MNPKEYKQLMDYLVAPKKKRTFKPLIPNLIVMLELPLKTRLNEWVRLAHASRCD